MPHSYRLSYVALGGCLAVLALGLGLIHAQEVDDDADAEPRTEISEPAVQTDPNPALLAIRDSIEDLSAAIEAVAADPNAAA